MTTLTNNPKSNKLTNDSLVNAHELSKFQKACSAVKSGFKLNPENKAAQAFTKKALDNKINGSSYILLKKEFGNKIDDIINNINITVDHNLYNNKYFINSNYNPKKAIQTKNVKWMDVTVKFPSGRGNDSEILTGTIVKVYNAGGVERCIVKCGEEKIMKRISTIEKYNI